MQVQKIQNNSYNSPAFKAVRWADDPETKAFIDYIKKTPECKAYIDTVEDIFKHMNTDDEVYYSEEYHDIMRGPALVNQVITSKKTGRKVIFISGYDYNIFHVAEALYTQVMRFFEPDYERLGYTQIFEDTTLAPGFKVVHPKLMSRVQITKLEGVISDWHFPDKFRIDAIDMLGDIVNNANKYSDDTVKKVKDILNSVATMRVSNEVKQVAAKLLQK